MAMATYGVEIAAVANTTTQTLAAAIKKAFHSRNTHQKNDCAFNAGIHGTDLDPCIIAFKKRCVMLRRVTGQRPAMRSTLDIEPSTCTRRLWSRRRQGQGCKESRGGLQRRGASKENGTLGHSHAQVLNMLGKVKSRRKGQWEYS